jgi:hypothetical protein
MEDNPTGKVPPVPDDPNRREDPTDKEEVPGDAAAVQAEPVHAPVAAVAQVPNQAPPQADPPVPVAAPVAGPGGAGGGDGPVLVPYLIGMVRETAISTLTLAGLVEGDETSVISAVNVHCVTRTIPAAGAQVHRGDSVAIDISAGTKLTRLRWWESTTSIFAVLGGFILVALSSVFAYSIATGGSDLIQELAKFDVARGVITFLIAFSTVSIALVLVISTVVLQDSAENEKRFDRGKQVLTVLIGVLGTIVGFYFASDSKGANSPTITSSSIPSATAGSPYKDVTLTENGGTAPFKWTVKPELPKDIGLSEAGVISGTPAKVASDSTFTFTVLDANSKSDSKTLHFEVKATESAPTPTPQGSQPPPGKMQ